MSRTILSQTEGFTPVIDKVIQDTGSVITAVVFGRIWRFCQMEDGVCKASLETIAEGLGMSRTAIMIHAKKLVNKGYLRDLTPNLRNHPHSYADTGKASLTIGISAGPDVNVVDVENIDVNVVDASVNVVDTGVNVVHLKKVLKKDIKKLNTTTTTGDGEIFKIYEREIGPLTPIISQEIGIYLDDPQCPAEYIADAIHEAALNNKRNWRYIAAILKRWMVEGKQPRITQPAGPKYPNKPIKGDNSDFFKALEKA